MTLRNLLTLAATGFLLTAGPAIAEPTLDWQAHSDVGVIDVITTDEDGDLRDVPVWFVEVDGAIYLRTSASRWVENLRRDPNLVVRIDDVEYPQRAIEVTGDEMIAAVDAASAEKYGWQESFIHFFRSSPPDIMRLEPPVVPEAAD